MQAIWTSIILYLVKRKIFLAIFAKISNIQLFTIAFRTIKWRFIPGTIINPVFQFNFPSWKSLLFIYVSAVFTDDFHSHSLSFFIKQYFVKQFIVKQIISAFSLSGSSSSSTTSSADFALHNLCRLRCKILAS